jgi:hypothetical protein
MTIEPFSFRLLPNRAFPPYTYVPGQKPHPESDPAGHSFGIQRPVAAPLNVLHPEASEPYLHAIDLFNAGYFWESHVEWESLWLACGRIGVVAKFLQGLIRLAAAGVKHHEGNSEGVRSHACRAAEYFREVAQDPSLDATVFLGFSLPALISAAEAVHREGWQAARPVLRPSLSAPREP